MHHCSKCNKDKEDIEFYKDASRAGPKKLSGWCKVCERSRASAIKKEFKNELNRIKSDNGCRVCGDKDPEHLDFHHIYPKTKKFNIADMFSRGALAIKAELSKCEILCRAHHLAEHFPNTGGL